tara:strand:- start:217 stop:357 length:141 start_codon:yes stop_codon:yes gene_type:complete
MIKITNADFLLPFQARAMTTANNEKSMTIMTLSVSAVLIGFNLFSQ